jgi:NADH:ubiquinone oxidoreductase subunit 3 (subunit A)
MSTLLFLPPIAFLVVFIFMALQLKGFALFSRGLKAPTKPGAYKAYACGEDVKDHRAQPDYSQFFPFAFFFTIMHVVALIVATIPGHSMPAVALATLYLVGAVIGLFILFRR